MPYYRTNLNQSDPSPVVKKYIEILNTEKINLSDCRILEIGVGATNSTGYELARMLKSIGSVSVYDPFITLDEKSDELMAMKKKYTSDEKSKVKRIDNINPREQKFDLILSHSVLEHVEDPESLFKNLLPLLSPQGSMLHIVDYRDHFFKYPYHFLTFSKSIWNKLLNPGDLYRWRLGDHIELLDQLGLKHKLLDVQEDQNALKKVKDKIKKEFKKKKYWEVTQASILVYRQ